MAERSLRLFEWPLDDPESIIIPARDMAPFSPEVEEGFSEESEFSEPKLAATESRFLRLISSCCSHFESFSDSICCCRSLAARCRCSWSSCRWLSSRRSSSEPSRDWKSEALSRQVLGFGHV